MATSERNRTDTASSTPDKQTLRLGLEQYRDRYLALLDRIGPEQMELPTSNPAWNVREILSHLAATLEMIPREVGKARQNKGMYNLPPFLLNRLNVLVTRQGARGMTKERLQARFEDAFAAALVMLDEVPEHEMGRGANFWSEGFLDVRGLFASQPAHFEEHEPDILFALSDGVREAALS